MTATTEDLFDATVPDGTQQIVSASKMQILGLEVIKTRLGKKWDRMSDLVHRYFDTAIRHALGPGDSFCNLGELSYVVLFRDLSVDDAQFKCAVIVEGVCKKLFGEANERLTVRQLVASLDFGELSSARARTQIDDTLERHGIETIFHNGNVDNPQPAARHLNIQMGEARGAVHKFLFDKPTFVFRPLWDTSRNVIVTYLCQVLPSSLAAAATISSLAVAVDKDRDQTALDVLVLKACLERTDSLRRAGLRVLLAVPCHFSTLSRPAHWSSYRACLVSAPNHLFRDIAFFVHGMDAGVPHVRLAQELPKLKAFSKQLFCLLEDTRSPVSPFRNTGVHAVGVACALEFGEQRWIEELTAVVRRARDNGLDTFVLGVSKRSAAVNAIGAGARYIEGKTVRAMIADPQNGFVQEIEHLYRAEAPVAR